MTLFWSPAKDGISATFNQVANGERLSVVSKTKPWDDVGQERMTESPAAGWATTSFGKGELPIT